MTFSRRAVPSLFLALILICAAVALSAASIRRSLSSPQAAVDTIVYQRVPDNSGPWPTIDIYSINSDGTNDVALTHDGHSHDPSWSPDGKQILFIHDAALQAQPAYEDSEPSHHPVELYVMNRDGSLAHLIERMELIVKAAWSPDGNTIAVQRASRDPLCFGERCGGSARLYALGHVYLVSSDGEGEPHLLFPYSATEPTWSPDGKRLLFGACRPIPPTGLPTTNELCGDRRTWVANADGSNAVQLDDLRRRPYEYAWSPKGDQIAVAADLRHVGTGSSNVGYGDSGIFVMNADGSNVRQLTYDRQWGWCRHPSWSPDGERIAFSCTSSTRVLTNEVRVSRLFVILVSDPPQHLTPLTQSYGDLPAFAPK